MARAKVTNYNSISDIKDEDLRAEAEGWIDQGHTVVCGSARILPDNPKDPDVEGFFDEQQGRGMCMWDGSMSDWMYATDLIDLFQIYAADM